LYIYRVLFIHPLVDRRLSCFHFGAVMTRNIFVQVFVRIHVFSFLGHIPRRDHRCAPPHLFWPFLSCIIYLFYHWLSRMLYMFKVEVLYQIYDLPNPFFHPVGCLFIFLMLSFEAQKLKILMHFNTSIFSLGSFCFGYHI
jgi:hypothetical protein